VLFPVISFRNKDFSGQGKRAEREQLPLLLAKALAPIGDDGETGQDVDSSAAAAAIAGGASAATGHGVVPSRGDEFDGPG